MAKYSFVGICELNKIWIWDALCVCVRAFMCVCLPLHALACIHAHAHAPWRLLQKQFKLLSSVCRISSRFLIPPHPSPDPHASLAGSRVGSSVSTMSVILLFTVSPPTSFHCACRLALFLCSSFIIFAGRASHSPAFTSIATLKAANCFFPPKGEIHLCHRQKWSQWLADARRPTTGPERRQKPPVTRHTTLTF